MAVTKLRALLKKDIQNMGTLSANGETVLDRAKQVSAAFAEPIGATLRFLGRSIATVLTEIGKIDVAIGDALGFAEFQEQLRYSKENNLKMNQVSIELMAIRIRKVDKQYNLGVSGYAPIFSFENFNGPEIKYENYSKMSMEGLGDIIGKIVDKVKGFFSKLWDSLRDGVKGAVNLRGLLLEKIEAYDSVLHAGLDAEPKEDTFPVSKKMTKGIFAPNDFSMEDVKHQHGIQTEAFDLVSKFTDKIYADLSKFESSFRRDPERGMSGLADDLMKFKDFTFGDSKKPLAGYIYYDIEITDEGTKNVRVSVEKRKAAVTGNSNATAKTLTGEEMNKILDNSKSLLGLSEIAFAAYNRSFNNVKQTKKVAEKDLSKIPDKELSGLAKSYTTLYDGMFALCPAIAILMLDTNLKYVDSALSYIDESFKRY